MTFLDDEARDQFHKIGTLMQIVCSILEFECAKFYGQLQLIGCEVDTAMVVAEDMSVNDLLTVCKKLNSQFVRKDKLFTVSVHDTTLKTVKVFVTTHHDLEHLL